MAGRVFGLTAPSHYLNQSWLIICGVLLHSPKIIFTASAQNINLQRELEIYNCQITSAVRGQWVKKNFGRLVMISERWWLRQCFLLSVRYSWKLVNQWYLILSYYQISTVRPLMLSMRIFDTRIYEITDRRRCRCYGNRQVDADPAT